jgi:hypothetical protein
VPLVYETRRDAIVSERPDLLDQAIVEFPVPLAREKRDDFCTSIDEFGTVAPLTVDGVRERYTLRIARVPRVLGRADLLSCGLSGEWRERWTSFSHTALSTPDNVL